MHRWLMQTIRQTLWNKQKKARGMSVGSDGLELSEKSDALTLTKSVHTDSNNNNKNKNHVCKKARRHLVGLQDTKCSTT